MPQHETQNASAASFEGSPLSIESEWIDRSDMRGEPTPMPDELKDLFDKLHDECAWLHIKWNEYRNLYDVDQSTINDLNECAGNFLGLVQRALLDSIIMDIARLIDAEETRNNQNNSIHRLKKVCETLNKTDIVMKFKEEINKIKCELEKVKTYRNKILAHNDAQIAVEFKSEYNQYKLSQDVIPKVLKGLECIMNIVNQHYNPGVDTAYRSAMVLMYNAKSLICHLQNSLRYDKIKEKYWNGEPLERDDFLYKSP